MDDAYREWKDQGRPSRDPKGDRCKKQPRDEPEEPVGEPEKSPETTPFQQMVDWAGNHKVMVIGGALIVAGTVTILTGGAAAPLLVFGF
jgi:hypothetical protein